MAIQALNQFKTVTANLTTEDTILYTAPSRKTAIFLSIQACNVTDGTAQVNFYHGTSANAKTSLARNFRIPSGDSLSLISPGSKLVLEQNEKVFGSATANNEVELVISVLESSNE